MRRDERRVGPPGRSGADFPPRLMVAGGVTALPKETFAALSLVAGCASTDATRYVLNGVLFTQENGGLLVATDGRRLAAAPARFTGRKFILPTPAVHVLCHPDFAGRDATVRQPDDGKSPYAEFRSGPHTLIAKEVKGTFPNYRQVVPTEFLTEALIPETHRPALIAWLKSLPGSSQTVTLSWGCLVNSRSRVWTKTANRRRCMCRRWSAAIRR